MDTPKQEKKMSKILPNLGRGQLLMNILDGQTESQQPSKPTHHSVHGRISPSPRKGVCDFFLSATQGMLPDECSYCNRPLKNIVCRACGHVFTGRVRARCPHHPEVIHLMDVWSCPNCKASQLKEFDC